MSRKLLGLVVWGVVGSIPARANAQAAALLAVADAAQVTELRLAKVMADESSLWLSVRLQGSTRLALVTADAGVEAAPAADAWLRALDFATRVRVAAPLGPLATCGSLQQFEPDDTGLPEASRLVAFEVSSESTELALRRRLLDAGLPADVERVAQFTSATPPPFRLALYDVPASGGSTEALRLVDRGRSTSLPPIAISGARAVPLGLIALASAGVQPESRDSVDPSEFPVVYRAISASSDYLSARRDWLTQNPTRWLNEVQATEPVFTDTALPSGAGIGSVISRYFRGSHAASASVCEARVRAAHERASTNADDFACDGADDLARTLSEVGFVELRSSRFWGSLGADGAQFRVVAGGSRSPLLFATDFDQSGCPSDISPPVGTPTPIAPPPPATTDPVVVGTPDDPYGRGPTPTVTTGVYSEGSCTGSPAEPGANDSCSGDSSSSDSSSDSCSGDSSDSKYDGDTCSGNSAESKATGAKRAALRTEPARVRGARPRPRPVRLSLVTLLAAALALPLRRRYASR